MGFHACMHAWALQGWECCWASDGTCAALIAVHARSEARIPHHSPKACMMRRHGAISPVVPNTPSPDTSTDTLYPCFLPAKTLPLAHAGPPSSLTVCALGHSLPCGSALGSRQVARLLPAAGLIGGRDGGISEDGGHRAASGALRTADAQGGRRRRSGRRHDGWPLRNWTQQQGASRYGQGT